MTEEIFKQYREDQKRVLPDVKLMENNDKPIYLPTDTAPARVFNYSMLQRLVEPKIYPLADRKNGKARITLNHGVDVTDFKNKLAQSPNDIPQMSSLGIGYNLNMHQAWVPDGFALGNLLYSLVLAPGEEQRLIVRENKQSYVIQDNAEGTDYTEEEYESGQQDNTTAAYEYGLSQMMHGDSHYDYYTKSTSVGFSAGFSGFGASLGLSVGHSSSKGNANSSANQSNSHNEASRAAQDFQNSIKSASSRIASAQRVSMSLATSDETDSVATRIIANHNHSHTMTIQYWEVSRRYRLETCVDGVDLVLFVPIKLINFLNGTSYMLDSNAKMNKALFESRYKYLLQYADVLMTQLPYSYRNGLKLLKKYAAMPEWTLETKSSNTRTITFSFYGNFLPYDNIEAYLWLKNGKPKILGNVELEYDESVMMLQRFGTSDEIKKAIREFRKKPRTTTTTTKYSEVIFEDITIPATPKCTCTFTIPEDITDDELSRIAIYYSCEDLHYELYKSYSYYSKDGETAAKTEKDMYDYMWDLVKDTKNSDVERAKINYLKSVLPESFSAPNVHLTGREVKRLGVPKIMEESFKVSNNSSLTGTLSTRSLENTVYVDINGKNGYYVVIKSIENTTDDSNDRIKKF